MESHVKANYDAALDSKKERMGIGIVIRYAQGEVLVSLCSSKGKVNNPIEHPA